MMGFLILFLHVLVSPFKTRARLEAEIVMLVGNSKEVLRAVHEGVLDLGIASEPITPEYLTALNNLGEVHHYRNKLDQAESEYRQVLEGWARATVPDERERLSVINNLAMVHQARGQYGETIRVFLDMLPDMKRVFGPLPFWDGGGKRQRRMNSRRFPTMKRH